MTKRSDNDSLGQERGDAAAPGKVDRCGLRLTQAELARLLGCSKQSVSKWISSEKVTLGADGRVDPRQAVAQLLRNSNPTRLRAKVLAPLLGSVEALRRRIAELEAEVARWQEDAEFHEGVSMELAGLVNDMHHRFAEERDLLAAMPAEKVVDIVIDWLAAPSAGEREEVFALANMTAEEITEFERTGAEMIEEARRLGVWPPAPGGETGKE